MTRFLRNLRANSLPLKVFYESVGKLPAGRVTIVLDACFSGNSGKGLIFEGISPGTLRVKKEYAAPGNSLLLLSGSPDQVSTWYPEMRHSLFTYHFLKAVQGAADADRNGVITAKEMRDWLEEKVPNKARQLRNIDQTPCTSPLHPIKGKKSMADTESAI